jgi:hypothetical protein
VKAATFSPDGGITHVEFFPRGLLDVSDLVPGDSREMATEPPPAMPEDGPPKMRIPPAMAAILRKGSVS